MVSIGLLFVFLLFQNLSFSISKSIDSAESTLELVDILADILAKEAYGSNKQEEEKPFLKFSGRLTNYNNLKSRIGQIGGVATDQNGYLVVFHRASRKWDLNSFSFDNKLNPQLTAIQKNCVLHINSETAEVVRSWGKNLFYMPHGLYIDTQQNIWLTDVGLHQVFKFDAHNLREPSLVLGVEKENGNDETHFCKPTDVAVRESNGDIFVADGYCNSRVVQFDKDGKFKKIFEVNDKKIRVAHSLVLIDDLNLVCVADRENNRIVCFDIETGEVKSILPIENRVFGIEYDRNYNLLHAVTGSSNRTKPRGYTFDMSDSKNFGKVLFEWKPRDRSFVDPHALTVSPDGLTIYVGELDGEIDEFSF